MKKNPIFRSLVQIVGLAVIALLLMVATPRAATAFDECDDQLAMCDNKCGSSVVWAFQYQFWDVHHHWNEQTQQWEAGWTEVWDWETISGIDYFECQPGSGHGICECRY